MFSTIENNDYNSTFELLNTITSENNFNFNLEDAAADVGVVSCDLVNVSSLLLSNLNNLLLETTKLTNYLKERREDFYAINKNVETHPTTGIFSTATSSSSPSSISSNSSEETLLDNDGLRTDYNYNEALIYVVFILMWYSLSVVALICMQIKKTDLQHLEDSDDPDENIAHHLLRRTKGEHIKREALEDLRDPRFRQKMWNIYLANPFSYKIRRIEIKRLQQIDRKLKQYNSSNERDYYKTIDFSQLESNKSKAKPDNLFLLRNLNTTTIHPSANPQYQQYTAQQQANYMRQHSSPAWWNQQQNWQPVTINQSSNQSQMTNNPSSISRSNSTDTLRTNETSRSSRFKVEKIQDIV